MFLTRPPREPPEGDPVRLACIRHAASVDPEPGSNSPPTPAPRGQAFFSCCVRCLPGARRRRAYAAPRPGPGRTVCVPPAPIRPPQGAPDARGSLLRLRHTTPGPPAPPAGLPPDAAAPRAVLHLSRCLSAGSPTGKKSALHCYRAEVAYPASGAARTSYGRRRATCDLLNPSRNRDQDAGLTGRKPSVPGSPGSVKDFDVFKPGRARGSLNPARWPVSSEASAMIRLGRCACKEDSRGFSRPGFTWQNPPECTVIPAATPCMIVTRSGQSSPPVPRSVRLRDAE